MSVSCWQLLKYCGTSEIKQINCIMKQKIILATSEDGSIEYVPVTKDILQESLEVMHKSFYLHENICIGVGLPNYPECFPEMDMLARTVANDGISVAALHKASGKVAGVAINKFQESGNLDFYAKLIKSFKNKVTKNVIKCMADIDKFFDIYAYSKAESAVEIMLVGIVPEFRKRGIAKKLFEVSIQVARSLAKGDDVRISVNGGKLEPAKVPEIVTAICTSFVTQKIAKGLSFETATRIDFNKFECDGVSLGSRIPDQTRSLTYDYIRL